MTDLTHRHLHVGHLTGGIHKLILHENGTDHEQSHERQYRTEDYTAALHPFHKTLQRALAHQLDGEDIEHRHASSIY